MIIFLLQGCIVIDLIPPYSDFFREKTWINKKTGKSLPSSVFLECHKKALETFNITEDPNGGLPIGTSEEVELAFINTRAQCYVSNGYNFNASFIYCYRFKSTCTDYNKYR